MKFNKEIYDNLKDGREVHLFTLRTSDGAELKLTNFGATVVSLKVPDRNGDIENVILGFKDFKDYENIRHVYDDASGRRMDIFTTEPAIQFYSGNFMDGSDIGHEGLPYNYRSAMCLETQHFPDSPNHQNFPTTVLNPGDVYRSTTKYTFSVRE